MNADALLLYSYLMRQDIPFTRFCHPAYRDRTQWIQSLKKSKLEPVFPVCRVFVSTTGSFLLMLGTDAETVSPPESYAPAEPAELQQICEILHCCSTKSTSAGCGQTAHCGNRSCCAFRPVRTLPVC